MNSPHYKLTAEEMEKLNREEIITDFKCKKLESEVQKNWDLFYKRNKTKFFKDRHWTKREFSELCGDSVINDNVSDCKVILEAGCGVGNLLFPLLEDKIDQRKLFIYACDFSHRAIDFVKQHELYNEEHCLAFPCDLTEVDCLSSHIGIHCGKVSIATLVFVLSAIHPDKMKMAISNIAQVLAPGGALLFRDYALYDHAMLRFGRGTKLADHWYVRQDGTRAYYFTTDEITSLCRSCGLSAIHCRYIERQTVNKNEDLCVRRFFVQGKFVKLPER